MADLSGLTVFCGILKQPLVRAFGLLLKGVAYKTALDGLALISRWSDFMETLIRLNNGGSFYSTMAFLTLTDENHFTRSVELRGAAALSSLMETAVKNDLARLGRIAAFDFAALGLYVAGVLRDQGLEAAALAVEADSRALAPDGRLVQKAAPGAAAAIFPSGADWAGALPAFTAYLHTRGAGDLSLYNFFFWNPPKLRKARGFIRPVPNPDPVRLADLSGYEDQRSVVIENTLRFLEGQTANNLLLYGDRGTGKSATVKAVCAEYAEKGLRLLELHKDSLIELPVILDYLSARGKRFIIFIDDLSFENADDSFTTLKALLEGGVETRPSNTVVYATTNRRHLVKERLADRPTTEAASSGDVRAFDTMQEQFSLADRFGLTVVFTAPGQDQYLNIAEFIACRRGLLPPGEDDSPAAAGARRIFRENALRWERWFNGRSPRTAVQYVDWIAGGAGAQENKFPWD